MSLPENNSVAVGGGDDVGDELEEFSEEFTCCVCLSAIYEHKGGVGQRSETVQDDIVDEEDNQNADKQSQACGHISCFWCIFEAMDTWQESRCPVCRHPYYHFPSICWLLHSVLLKLYPKAYQRRESQVTKYEKAHGTFSPQFENYLAVSNGDEQTASQRETIVVDKGLSDTESSEPVLPENNSTTGLPTCLSDKITTDVDRSYKQISVNDLLCSKCHELLYRPVVLNCGHVICEACIVASTNEPCRCPECRSMHPNGFPKVCLVLHGFLEQHVSEEYAARRDKLRSSDPGSSSTVPQGAKSSAVAMDEHMSSSGHKVHFGVGCDGCGMCPLIGNRYKCTDCFESIGFDLCEDCHNSSSKLPGRFNQQHKPSHKFEVIEPHPIIILSSDLPGGFTPHYPELQTDDSTAPDLSPDSQQEPEDDVADPVHTNDTLGSNEDVGPIL